MMHLCFVDGNETAVGYLADDVLELQGGVVDAEALAQDDIEAVEDEVALGGRDVGDDDVAGESVGVGAEAPDMQVVDVFDAVDGGEGSANLDEGDAAGRAFEEDVEGFAHDGDRRPENERGNGQGERGIDPGAAGEQDNEAPDDDCGGGQRVTQHVDEDAADVDVVADAPEHGGDEAVHEHAGGGPEHHDAGLHGRGVTDAVDSFVSDPAGDDDERERIKEGGKDAGALVAEGLLVSSGTRLKPDGDEGEHDGEGVGGVVAGFRNQGERVGAQSGKEREQDVGDGGDEGKAQHPLHGRGIGAMNMHMGLVYSRKAWSQERVDRRQETGEALLDGGGRLGLALFRHGARGDGVGGGAQTAPVLGDDYAVFGAVDVVAHR